MERYQGKKVVITGGTSGMGLATAKMLLGGGARVLVTGRSQAGLDSAQKELGKDAFVVSSDARSLTDIDALASRVKAEFDTFDLLFVNAGFSTPTTLESMTESVYDEMFNLNAKGPFFAVQKLAPLINRGGAVVFTTSVANVKGMPGQVAYGAAKAALRSFARTLATELIPAGIRVNAVTPGPIDTPILDKAFPDKNAAAKVREHITGIIPMKRFGTEDEIAKAVLFLAFDATFTTVPNSPSTAVGRNSECQIQHTKYFLVLVSPSRTFSFRRTQRSRWTSTRGSSAGKSSWTERTASRTSCSSRTRGSSSMSAAGRPKTNRRYTSHLRTMASLSVAS